MKNTLVNECMAARGRNNRKQPIETRKIVGSYKIQGVDTNPRITISTDLDDEPFPNHLGQELKVELVIPADEDEDSFLELHPKEEQNPDDER